MPGHCAATFNEGWWRTPGRRCRLSPDGRQRLHVEQTRCCLVNPPQGSRWRARRMVRCHRPDDCRPSARSRLAPGGRCAQGRAGVDHLTASGLSPPSLKAIEQFTGRPTRARQCRASRQQRCNPKRTSLPRPLPRSAHTCHSGTPSELNQAGRTGEGRKTVLAASPKTERIVPESATARKAGGARRCATLPRSLPSHGETLLLNSCAGRGSAAALVSPNASL